MVGMGAVVCPSLGGLQLRALWARLVGLSDFLVAQSVHGVTTLKSDACHIAHVHLIEAYGTDVVLHDL